MARTPKTPLPTPTLVIQNRQTRYTVRIPREEFEAHCPVFRADWEVIEGQLNPEVDQ